MFQSIGAIARPGRVRHLALPPDSQHGLRPPAPQAPQDRRADVRTSRDEQLLSADAAESARQESIETRQKQTREHLGVLLGRSPPRTGGCSSARRSRGSR